MTVVIPEQVGRVASILPVSEAQGGTNREVARNVTRLLRATPEVRDTGVVVWLNGSTASGTALPGSSDVDLWLSFPPVEDGDSSSHERWLDRRTCAIQALTRVFGPGDIEERQKCLYIRPKSPNGVELDFTVAQMLPKGAMDEKEFWTLEGERITTSPSKALKNITQRDIKTGGAFKRAVLELKRIKRELVGADALGKHTAPGYHLLGIVNAMSDAELRLPAAQRIVRAASIIKETVESGSNIPTVVGTHHMTFGPGSTEWKPTEAEIFASALVAYVSDSQQQRIIVA